MSDQFMQAAIEQARKSLSEGGVPIGAVLVKDGQIISRGHNQRVQKKSPILHAEMDALENAGCLDATDYMKCTLYTTLSPCDMCSGAALLYKIPKIVIGENKTYLGAETLLKSKGVELEVLDDPECKTLMEDFIKKHPKLWNQDIGE